MQDATWRSEKLKSYQLGDKDKLNSSEKNFHACLTIHTRILQVNDLYEFVLETILRLDKRMNSIEYNRWEKENEVANIQLIINMNLMLYYQLNKEMNDSIRLWVNILKRFEHLSVTIVANANERLKSKKIQLKELMKTHIDSFKKLQDEYMNCGENLFNNEFRIIIVYSLTSHSIW